MQSSLSFALHCFLSFSIPASPHLHIQVNTNGLLSFAMLQSPYLPTPFSLTNQPLVAPFWGDVDTRSSGNVFYRQTSDQALLDEVGMEIRRSFVNSRGFFPTSLFIATWNDVGYYDNHADLVSVSRTCLLDFFFYSKNAMQNRNGFCKCTSFFKDPYCNLKVNSLIVLQSLLLSPPPFFFSFFSFFFLSYKLFSFSCLTSLFFSFLFLLVLQFFFALFCFFFHPKLGMTDLP